MKPHNFDCTALFLQAEYITRKINLQSLEYTLVFLARYMCLTEREDFTE